MFKAKITVEGVEKMCVESGKIGEKSVEIENSLNKLLIVEKYKNVETVIPHLSGQPAICIC